MFTRSDLIFNFSFWQGGDIIDVIVKFVNFLLTLSFSLAVLFIIVGGVRYVISAGSPDKVEEAKKTIFNAIIGLVVILLSMVVVNTIGNLFS